MEKIDRDIVKDRELVLDYLKDFPEPSFGTLQEVYWPKNVNDGYDWSDFRTCKWNYKLAILREVMPNNNAILNGLPALALEDVRVKHFNQPIELVDCKIGTLSEIKPWLDWVKYRCINCNNELAYKVEQVPPGSKIKAKCCDDPVYIKVADPDVEREGIDSQWLNIHQRKPNFAKAMIPLQMIVLVKHDPMMFYANSKDRINIIGIVKSRLVREKDGSTSYDKWFEAYGIRKIDSSADITNTEQDKAYIRSEMSKLGFYDKFLKSFCPQLYGIETMKEACIIAIASIGLQRCARVLIIADPAMGKSVLTNYCVELIPRAVRVQMGRATKTGFTASAELDRDTGRRHVRPGVMVDADGSLLCIDEAQLGKEEDFMNLNDVIESGKVTYALPGGVNGSFDANPAIIMTCNAHAGKIGDERNVAEICRFMGKDMVQMLSRQDIVLIVRDESSSEHERKRARHMIRHDENVTDWQDKYAENWMEETIQTIQIIPGLSATVKTYEERFGRKWIRKIIHYVTNDVKSEYLSPEFEESLIDYYMNQRDDFVQRVNKIAMDIRFLRHGIVIARYIARLKGRSKPEHDDVTRAMQLLEQSLTVAAFDPKIQEIDMSVFNNQRSKVDRQKMSDEDSVQDSIESYMKEKDPDGKKIHQSFTLQDICSRLWFDDAIRWNNREGDIKRIIKRLMHANIIYEKGAPGSGEYGLS